MRKTSACSICDFKTKNCVDEVKNRDIVGFAFLRLVGLGIMHGLLEYSGPWPSALTILTEKC